MCLHAPCHMPYKKSSFKASSTVSPDLQAGLGCSRPRSSLATALCCCLSRINWARSPQPDGMACPASKVLACKPYVQSHDATSCCGPMGACSSTGTDPQAGHSERTIIVWHNKYGTRTMPAGCTAQHMAPAYSAK